MNINTTNLVVSISFRFLKIKKLKLWANKLKKVLKNLKTQAVSKFYDLATSDESIEFCINPRKSRIFLKIIKPLFLRLGLSLLNAHIMARVDTKTPILNFSKKFLILEKSMYISGIFIKIFFIWKNCSTISSTPLVISSLLIEFNSKEKIVKNIQVSYFAKGKVLNLFYILSLEFKVADFVYYSLMITESRRVVQLTGLAKCLRQLDFLILLIIIVIQISFTIIDSINSNSNKK